MSFQNTKNAIPQGNLTISKLTASSIDTATEEVLNSHIANSTIDNLYCETGAVNSLTVNELTTSSIDKGYQELTIRLFASNLLRTGDGKVEDDPLLIIPNADPETIETGENVFTLPPTSILKLIYVDSNETEGLKAGLDITITGLDGDGADPEVLMGATACPNGTTTAPIFLPVLGYAIGDPGISSNRTKPLSGYITYSLSADNDTLGGDIRVILTYLVPASHI